MVLFAAEEDEIPMPELGGNSPNERPPDQSVSSSSHASSTSAGAILDEEQIDATSKSVSNRFFLFDHNSAREKLRLGGHP